VHLDHVSLSVTVKPGCTCRVRLTSGLGAGHGSYGPRNFYTKTQNTGQDSFVEPETVANLVYLPLIGPL